MFINKNQHHLNNNTFREKTISLENLNLSIAGTEIIDNTKWYLKKCLMFSEIFVNEENMKILLEAISPILWKNQKDVFEKLKPYSKLVNQNTIDELKEILDSLNTSDQLDNSIVEKYWEIHALSNSYIPLFYNKVWIEFLDEWKLNPIVRLRKQIIDITSLEELSFLEKDPYDINNSIISLDIELSNFEWIESTNIKYIQLWDDKPLDSLERWNLPNLERLDLYGSKVNNLKWSFPALKVLNLQEHYETRWDKIDFTEFKASKLIDLTVSDFPGGKVIWNFPKLNKIDLSGVKWTLDLTDLTTDNLETLEIKFARDLKDMIWTLPSLKKVIISNCMDIKHIGNMLNAIWVDLNKIEFEVVE